MKILGVGTYLIIAIVLTAGTAFLMWLGEQITAKGVGNGISIIIFAGIVAGIPTTASTKFMHNNLKMLVMQLFIKYH